MNAVITVIGNDKVGIIAEITTVLAKYHVNILDISQTILQNYFTMIMIVDLSKMNISFDQLSNNLIEVGKEIELSVKIQHQDIFNAMHKI